MRARWRALRTDRAVLEDHEDQLLMALEVFQRASVLEGFTIFDLIAFSEVDRHTKDFEYCVKLINLVEGAVISPQPFLDLPRVLAFRDFIAKSIAAIEARTVDGELCLLDKNTEVRVTVPPQFQSRKACIDDYRNFALCYFTKYLPDDFLSVAEDELLDPFGKIEDIPASAKLIGHLSIVHWALRGYVAVCRMCLTKEQIKFGSARNVSEGKIVDAFFAEAGVRLNGTVLDGSPVFDVCANAGPTLDARKGKDGYIQVWDTNSALGDKRYVLPGPEAVRNDPESYPPDFGAEFCNKWQSYVAYVAQQIMRARHFALVGTSRKELVHIRRIKDFQDKTFAKLIALAITLGITFGQSIAGRLSDLLFGAAGEYDGEF